MKNNFFCNVFPLIICLYFHSTLANAHFVIVITSYNNEKYYENNLRSVFEQSYPFYSIKYIDDASTDQTANLIEQYIKRMGQEHRFTLIRNEQWQGQLANHYYAAHACADDDIIVHLDGDDALATPDVLSLLARVYTDSDVWFTYGQNTQYTDRPITPQEIKNNTIRELHPATFSHLRSFYAWLFKQIKLEDLLYQGTFKGANPTPDSFFMYPIAEMAGFHGKFISRVLYLWNMQNPISQWQLNTQLQTEVWHDMQKKYTRYEALYYSMNHAKDKYRYAKADVIIFATNVTRTQKLIDSFSLLKNNENLWVIPINPEFDSRQIHFPSDVPCYAFNPYNDSASFQFFLQMMTLAHEHVLLLTDTYYFQDSCDCSACIYELERTQALGFYLPNEKKENMPPSVSLLHSLCAWQFSFAQYTWQEPQHFNQLHQPDHLLRPRNSGLDEWSQMYSCAGVIYRKTDLLSLLRQFKITSTLELLDFFSQPHEDLQMRKIGLFYEKSPLKSI